jgi:Alw26I/Eco31I/Esp3I family type II restriction endonuclease
MTKSDKEYSPEEIIAAAHASVSDDPSLYGSKGQSWNADFVRYMKSIVTHPVYKGMPDAVNGDGKIQWEAPSNRSGGQFQYTHQKRRDWWQQKAMETGIDPSSDKWISRTAKTIHPTGEKPCKRCGTVLRLAYAYPNSRLLIRLNNAFDDGFADSPLEPIDEIIQRAVDLQGPDAINMFAKILSTPALTVPLFGDDLDGLLSWVEDVYIPSESSLLSPGAMSNAPDRFDGFHSFNLCCRGSADTGRAADNLKSYSTDRRVFEFWSDGDWIAADRMMGLVRTVFRSEQNADGGEGAPSADHIGPVSLGFCHTPVFRLLSRAANSARNNRMTFGDVKLLLSAEEKGASLCSWYAQHLWDLRKDSVDTDEKALRLSKLLRDNQRNAMLLLSYLFEQGQYIFLIYLLSLDQADFNISFNNLRVENFQTVYDDIVREARNTKYAVEQKARRLRIGFEALRSYPLRVNRHMFAVESPEISEAMDEIIKSLNKHAEIYAPINETIKTVLFPEDGIISEEALRELITSLPKGIIPELETPKDQLRQIMALVAEQLSTKWESDRYVREAFDLD